MSMDTSPSPVRLEIADRIATVTIDRPAVLNALSHAVLLELDRIFAELALDPAVAGIIVTGGGQKAFVAGADIQELDQLDAAAAYRASRFGQGVFARLETMPKPSIAAVNGYALGGGLELALAATLRVAADSAKLGQPEVLLGVIPGYGGTQRLARLVGRAKAMEMILTGDPVGAAEAERIGLVNKVVPAAELLPAARALLTTILGRGPLAVAAALEVIRTGLDGPLATGLELEAQAFGRLFATRDLHEGMGAFREKRKAVFTGN
jgi:enoyl-CoA hydratase